MTHPPLDLEGIRKRLEAATPGPWTARCEQKQIYPGSFVLYPTGVNPTFIDDPWDWTQKDRPEIKQVCLDADFIAHAPGDIRTLLAECESLRAEVGLRNKRIVQTNGFLHEANKILTEMVEALSKISKARSDDIKKVYREIAKDALEKYDSWKKESK